MSTHGSNFPSYVPDNTYQYKINANAAWVKKSTRALSPSPRRRPLGSIVNYTNAPLTSWGTAYPLWRHGDAVLVQLYSPGGEWYRATVIEALMPREIRDAAEAELIPPTQRAKMTCQYTVKISERESGEIESIWTDLEEKWIVPAYLEERLKDNRVMFKMGEKVMVQMSATDGKQAQSHIGYISAILADRISRDKSSWHVAPRLYMVHLDEVGKSGYWTAGSIIRLAEPSTGALPPPPPGLVPSQRGMESTDQHCIYQTPL